MAPKILGLILIAVSYYITLAAPDPFTLDICNYSVNDRRVSCRPENYGLLKFDPDYGVTFTSAICGPLKIWESGSSDYFINLLELDTFNGIPQLVTIKITNGSTTKTKYFKSHKGQFVSIDENESLNNRTMLTQGNLIDNYIYLDLKKVPNKVVFDTDLKEYHGVEFSIILPKIQYVLIGVVYGTQMVFKSDKIYNVVIKMFKNFPRLIMVNSDGYDELKMFIFKQTWESCNSIDAQKFIKKIIDYEKDHPPTHSDNELIYASLQCPLYIPELYSNENIQSMNLLALCPTYPTYYFPGTSPEPKNIPLDLNDVTGEFTDSNLKHEDFDVIKIQPKNGYKVSNIIESGCLVWENDREYWVKEVYVYKRHKVPLLIKLHVYRNGDKTFYFHRFFGKLYPTTNEEFNKLVGRWRLGSTYDTTIAYSLHGANNQFLFKEVHDVDDGVYNLSVFPHEGFELVRIVNGSNELIRPNDEKWPTFTVTFFDSTHKMISLNVIKDDKFYVKYFKCSSYFTELEPKTHQNLFYQYKSQIHIQADIFFDLQKTKISEYNNLTEKACELIPLSGFHVKMVVYGNFVLWKSHKARCISVLPLKNDSLYLIKLKILEEGSTSQQYFRFVENKFIKLEEEEFVFMKRKIVENTRNPGSKEILEKNRFSSVTVRHHNEFDACRSSPFSLSYTNFNNFVLKTTYGVVESYAFNKITYDGSVFWQPYNNTHYITRFHLFFVDNKPLLGKFEGKLNFQNSVEYYDFSSGTAVLIDYTDFENFYFNYSDKIQKTVLENKLGNSVVLDLLKYDNFKATGRRWDDLISIEYVHKDQLTIDLIVFGYEILWTSKGGERAKNVVVVYYEKFPMILKITISGFSDPLYLSHYNGLWHQITLDDMKNEMQTLLEFEPKRIRFTLPELPEATEYDDSSFKGGNFTTRKFMSKRNLVTTILDGRSKLYSPDPFSFIECILLYYHGNTAKLLSFREKNLFGYSFDHYFAFKNGWRPVGFSLFEQFYNFFMSRPPKEQCFKNAFIFDIFKKDNRVTATVDPKNEYLLKFEVNQSDSSICALRNGDSFIWVAPKNRTLQTFYIYRDNKVPLIAHIKELDCGQNKHDIYIKLMKREWKEIDYSLFNESVKELADNHQSQDHSQSEISIQDSAEPLLVPPQRRRASRGSVASSQSSLSIPSGDTLDLSKPVDKNKFKVMSGKFKQIVPFNYYEPESSVTLKSVKYDDKVVWRTTGNNLSCSSLKCFIKDRTPVLFEILIHDVSRPNSKKYKYITYSDSEEKWKSCDEEFFNSSLNSLKSHLSQ